MIQSECGDGKYQHGNVKGKFLTMGWVAKDISRSRILSETKACTVQVGYTFLVANPF